jgi:hypothetical protein
MKQLSNLGLFFALSLTVPNVCWAADISAVDYGVGFSLSLDYGLVSYDRCLLMLSQRMLTLSL